MRRRFKKVNSNSFWLSKTRKRKWRFERSWKWWRL